LGFVINPYLYAAAGCTEEIDDDFSTDEGTCVNCGTVDYGVDTGNNRCDWEMYRIIGTGGWNIALPETIGGGTAEENYFLVQFTLYVNELTTGSYAQNKYIYIGLSTDNTCDSRASQNSAGLYWLNYATEEQIRVTWESAGSSMFNGGVLTSFAPSTGSTKYVRIIYDGSSLKLELYANSDFSDTPITATDSSAGHTSDSYDYFSMFGMHHPSQGSGQGSGDGWIQDLKIWKGRTTPC